MMGVLHPGNVSLQTRPVLQNQSSDHLHCLHLCSFTLGADGCEQIWSLWDGTEPKNILPCWQMLSPLDQT